VGLSRREVKDRINYRKNDRWSSNRFYGALQRLKSPMRYVCEIFGTGRFSVSHTIHQKRPFAQGPYFSGQTIKDNRMAFARLSP